MAAVCCLSKTRVRTESTMDYSAEGTGHSQLAERIKVINTLGLHILVRNM